MDVVIYWQSIVIFLISWLLVIVGLCYANKLFFPNTKLSLSNWTRVIGVFIISLLYGLFTGSFVQKTHLPEQHKAAKAMQSLIQSDERILTNYLEAQPDRKMQGKTLEQHESEVNQFQVKNDQLTLKIEKAE